MGWAMEADTGAFDPVQILNERARTGPMVARRGVATCYAALEATFGGDSTMKLHIDAHPTPIGPLGLGVDAEGHLRGVSFGDQSAEAMATVGRTLRREHPQAEQVRGAAPDTLIQLVDGYFAGELAALERIAWSLEGGAAGEGFQARVWRELARTQPGETLTYGEMARRAGEPGAAQAAGVALNRNPIALVLPCHRVVGADGAMVGFGGGMERKTWLLRHEGALLL